jgi:hypothetical protein
MAWRFPLSRPDLFLNMELQSFERSEERLHYHFY